MVSRGLLVELDAAAGKDAEVEEFLVSALPLVRKERATEAWFALRFGRGQYGIFDVFPDDAGLDAHLAGPVALALERRAGALLAVAPRIRRLNVLASKLPAAALTGPNSRGLLLTFAAKAGHDDQVKRFLRDARAFVDQEPETTAWFAIHLDDGSYGIFDVFPDQGGRFKHLAGHIPRELVKHGLSLLGSLPEMHFLDVLAEKVAVEKLAA